NTISGSRGGIITLGVTDGNSTLLVLDIKNSSGDPTGTDGAMYYNNNASKFRCYQNGAWADCITTSLLTDGGTETYLTSTSDDFMVGGSSVATSSLFADVSA